MVNVMPQANNVVLASKAGLGHKFQPEYWERFEDAFAREANEFIQCIVDNTEVPFRLEEGLLTLKIGWALRDALLSGQRIRFDEQGNRLDNVARL